MTATYLRRSTVPLYMGIGRIDETFADYSRHSYLLMRIGLGFVILLAGTHKLFEPAVWASYTAPWAADLMSSLGIPADLFMRGNGVLEGVLGLAILSDRYTALAAGLVSLSLLAILVNLASTGSFVDIMIRDIGLFILAVGVALMAAGRSRDSDASF